MVKGSASEGIALRSRGRPRRLTLDQLVQAGLDLGLEELSISGVALKLGVSVATIYTYVDSVGELRRLVTVALARTAAMTDVGQSWADIVRAQAALSFDLLSKSTHMLGQVISGSLGPEDAFREIDTFVALLAARGFGEDEAFDLYRTTVWIAGGAAVSAVMAASWAQHGETRAERLATALAEAPADAYPFLRRLGGGYFDDRDYLDYRRGIETVIAHVAARRGETPPVTEADRAAS